MIGRYAAMWMLEVASRSPDTVFGAARDLVMGERHRVQVLAAEVEEQMLYAPAPDGINAAFRALESGALRSIRVDFE